MFLGSSCTGRVVCCKDLGEGEAEEMIRMAGRRWVSKTGKYANHNSSPHVNVGEQRKSLAENMHEAEVFITATRHSGVKLDVWRPAV